MRTGNTGRRAGRKTGRPSHNEAKNFRPAPSCGFLLDCLPHIVPRPLGRGMSGRRACSPFAGARFGLLALFVFRVALSLVARSLLSRHRPCCRCSSCGASPLLAWRWRCHPGGCPHPSSVLVLVPSCVAWFAARVLPRACPSFVIRRSSDVAGCPVRRCLLMLFSALCLLAGVIRSVPVISIRFSPRSTCRGAGRVGSASVSIVGDLLVFLGEVVGWGGSSRCGCVDGEKK